MDTHYKVLVDGEVVIGGDYPFNVKSETVKGSNLSNAGLDSCIVRGGLEDCVDFVRGKNYVISNSHLMAGSGTRSFVTAKGGIDGLVMRNVCLSGETRWRHIRLGDHTIYNGGGLMGMKNVVLDGVYHLGGGAVKVLCLDCERPLCINGVYDVVVVPKVLVWLFMKVKKWTGK